MIEYVNSKGEQSTRRITVWGIKEGAGGIPLLVAKCHERKQTRTFRTDRIRCAIDYDGVVHEDVPVFLNETFGMSLSVSRLTERQNAVHQQEKQRSEWSLARSHLRPHAELLAALSLSDGTMRPAEIRIAVAHCLQIAVAAGFLIEGESKKLTAYIKRLRPTEKTLQNAVERLRVAPPHEITDLLVSAVSLMDVDGKRHSAEVELVNQLSQDIAGMDMA
ncbi:hypothetical protein [Roseibium sp.]|uniref:tellurite resistance TerB family protein n=1 Tax=Roseibium sp. TaxID=1936156 RepID=UPI00273F9895|nr:hypothetical protein [Roseibium sp. MMSF_3544]